MLGTYVKHLSVLCSKNFPLYRRNIFCDKEKAPIDNKIHTSSSLLDIPHLEVISYLVCSVDYYLIETAVLKYRSIRVFSTKKIRDSDS